MIACFTGHRPNKLGGYDENNSVACWIKRALVKAIERAKSEGYDTFISGMALGVDTWAAEIVLEMNLKLVAAIPCDEQDKFWRLEAKKRYQSILSRATEVVVVSPGPYASWKMQKRNEWMVDRSSLVIAVWDGSPGGTANCINYARCQGVRIWRIDPRKEY